MNAPIDKPGETERLPGALASHPIEQPGEGPRDLPAGQSHQHQPPDPQPGADAEPSAASRLTEQARDAAHQAKGVARDTAEQVKGHANEAVNRALEQGRQVLHEQKGRVASEIRTFSEAARRAADRLEEESDTNLSRYVSSAADRIEQLGRRIEEGEPEELLEDVRRIARRRPEVFFGGLFVAGLATARFLKSSRRDRLRESRPSTAWAAEPVVAPAPVTATPVATVATVTSESTVIPAEEPFAGGTAR